VNRDLSHSVSVDRIDEIPKETGCYIFSSFNPKTEKTKVLYVGKAINLRNRVRQYFVEDRDIRAFVQFIREKTNKIEYIVVSTEQDALVLENELIKKLNPSYNIHLRDDKRYLSLRLDLQEEWPKLKAVRRIKRDQALYFGPFSSGLKLKETLNVMQKIFPLRTCPNSKFYNRSRPCIEYDIKRCVAPCVGYVSPEEYKKLLDGAILFLRGQNEELLKILTEQMNQAADNEDFEEAALLRDRIKSIRQITSEHQSVIGHRQLQSGRDLDAIDYARIDGQFVVSILFIRNGILWEQRSFEMTASELDDTELLSQFISRYYSSEVYIPHEILLPFPLDLGKFAVTKLTQPRSAEKKNFLEMAKKNATARLEAKIQRTEKSFEILEALQKKLGLQKIPHHIDCLDISHHQGSEVVASVVRFSQALPDKNFYRKIKLKADQIDDFASMMEAVERRYKSKEDLPELIVIDGGKGQLSSAYEALKKKCLHQDVEVVSLAKARNSHEAIDPHNPKNRERVFKRGQKNPVLLRPESPEELLLTFLRDEAHRFAITYHRFRKDKALTQSVLDEVPGMTLRIKLKLLKHFGSVESVMRASDLDLLKILKPKLLKELRLKLNRQFEDEVGK